MRKKILKLLAWLLVIGAIAAHYQFDPWGFYWKVPQKEAAARMKLVTVAQTHLGRQESDGSHQAILDRYNTQEVLPRGYAVQAEDSWCATFVTAAAMEAGLADIIPPECGCERQIELWQELGQWEEDDNAIPLPGDIIYYNWDQKKPGENSGWSDHVGIVVGTKWPFVKVVEGNYDDAVKERVILLGDIRIRGYGFPEYAQ
jgi:cell wall-associated NlpC family hydrolase